MKSVLASFILVSILFSSCSKDSNSFFGQVTYYDKTSKSTQPAASAYIQILSTGKNAHYYDLNADASGYYDIKGIYSGSYTITATFSPDGTIIYTGSANASVSYNDDKVVDVNVQ